MHVGKSLGVKLEGQVGATQRGAREAIPRVQATRSFQGETGLHLDRAEPIHKPSILGETALFSWEDFP